MVVLPRVDTILQNKDQPALVDVLWFANLVDEINTAMQDIEIALASIDARLIAGGL